MPSPCRRTSDWGPEVCPGVGVIQTPGQTSVSPRPLGRASRHPRDLPQAGLLPHHPPTTQLIALAVLYAPKTRRALRIPRHENQHEGFRGDPRDSKSRRFNQEFSLAIRSPDAPYRKCHEEEDEPEHQEEAADEPGHETHSSPPKILTEAVEATGDQRSEQGPQPGITPNERRQSGAGTVRADSWFRNSAAKVSSHFGAGETLSDVQYPTDAHAVGHKGERYPRGFRARPPGPEPLIV